MLYIEYKLALFLEAAECVVCDLNGLVVEGGRQRGLKEGLNRADVHRRLMQSDLLKQLGVTASLGL